MVRSACRPRGHPFPCAHGGFGHGPGGRPRPTATPVPAGRATIRFEFAYDGGGFGKGGTGTIFVNGQKVAEGRIENTNANMFSGDEGADVGMDRETPVTENYREHDNQFTGKIDAVTVNLGN
jgi:hypothetical protein